MSNLVSSASSDAWIAFLSEIETTTMRLIGGSEDEIWFRGHTRSDYTMLPSLFRGHREPNTSPMWEKIWATESDLFWEFSARARELHTSLRTDWDYLFAMQHYRTPTRLLDWTEVLGVAVYFAVLGVDEAKHEEADGKPIAPPCVWVLNPYALNRESAGVESGDLYAPENIGWDAEEEQYYTYGELLLEDGIGFKNPLAVYPRQTNPRIHAQRAWFTMHGDEFVPLEKVAGELILTKVELPRPAISAARRFLEHAGIDHYLLFADLENLSRHLKEKNGYP